MSKTGKWKISNCIEAHKVESSSTAMNWCFSNIESFVPWIHGQINYVNGSGNHSF
jgi:hypothetical protein